MTFKEKVTTLLTEGLLEKPSIFDDLIITDAFKVIVTLDGDNGVVLQDCIDVSKFMDSNLDREEQDYSLVASVGVGLIIKIDNTRKYRSNTDSEDFYEIIDRISKC
jgi:ribosome maturation factor RimP